MTLLGNRFLAERVKNVKATTDGGIYLPPVVLDDNNTGGPKEWLVLQVGPGRRNRDGSTMPVEFVPGDRVICQSYTRGAADVGDGKFVLDADMVLAVIPSHHD